jgi:signal recognition particle subunit SRP54
MFDFLTNKFSSIFSSLQTNKKLTEHNIQDACDNVQDALLEADVPYDLVQIFIEEVKKEVIGQKVWASLKPGDQFIKIVHDRLKHFLGYQENEVPFSFQLPATVMIMGLQGSGKTTTVAKLASWAKKEAQKKGKERTILVGSVDFYRPAAVDQLELVAKQAGVTFYRSLEKDPIKAARDIQNYAKNHGFELLFLDTAGRLHVDNPMLQELQTIDKDLKPRYKFLVLDAMTGQESLTVARSFDQSVGFDHAILSKMDSDSRGGAAFSFRYVLKKPILFIGTGEKISDLEPFHADRMSGRILGMGDIVSLVEKADEKIKQSEQESAYKAFMSGNFSLQDFAQQMEMMGRLGSMSQLLKYIPGMGNMKLTPEMVEKGEQELKRFKAIISSMTPKERINPAILNSSRKQRIAKGAGVAVDQVNQLLQRFEQSKQYVKLFKKFGAFK